MKYGPNNSKLPENLQLILKDLIKKYENENSWVRKRQIMQWKKNERFWHGIQFIFWSETYQDWMAPVETTFFNDENSPEDTNGPFYDYCINVYKAHGEAIIAALAAQVPAVRFPPDDADNEDDLVTSKTFGKISDLIQKHNSAKRTLLQALLMLWNQGIVAAYHAPKFDRAFGNIQIPKYKAALQCPECGYVHEDIPPGTPDSTSNHSDNLGSAEVNCPQCLQGDFKNSPQAIPMEKSPILDGFSSSPKMRVLIDVYGPLHVKVPYYSRAQKDFSYLICSLDQPTGYLVSLYAPDDEDLAKKISSQGAEDAGNYERIGRSPSAYSYNMDGDQYLSTLKRCWLRPWVFDSLDPNQLSEKKELQQLFPDGVYVGLIGDVYIESRNEDMDKYWTIGQGGLSTYIHSDPVGQPLINIQEMRNVLVNLTLETIEQGIPSGFADPETVNFDVYSKHEARPGMLYPAKRKPGENMSNSFFEGSRATLSKEVPEFGNQLDKDGQFVVGSFPSIYGGPGEGNSRTAAEYNMSRQMALQRLSIIWALLNWWWCKLIEKCVHLYVENMIEDERFVTKDKNNYINVWIRRSELEGKVGEVEPEGDETFPISLAQKQGLLKELIGMNIPEIHSALFDVSNRKLVAEAFQFTELNMPGEDQRIKAARNIQQIVNETGNPTPEKDVDDPSVHIDTIRDYLVSEIGLDLKNTNPGAYGKCYQLLEAFMQLQAASQQPPIPEPPKFSESMQLDKMSPEIQAQVLEKYGIKVDPAVIASHQIAVASQDAKNQKDQANLEATNKMAQSQLEHNHRLAEIKAKPVSKPNGANNA